MRLKKILIALLALTLVLSGCSSQKEGVVATVDGTDIDQYKFDFYYYIQREQLVAYSGEEALEQGQEYDEFGRTFGEVMRTQLLDNLIENQVIINAAIEAGIDVEDQLNEQIQAQKDASGEEFYQELLNQLGLSEEEYIDITRDNLYVAEYANKRLEEIQVSDEEVQEYYDENEEDLKQVNARHILVETEEEAQNVLQRLEEGEDYGDLARELSTDLGSAENGGELGFYPQGSMVEEFDNYMFSADVNEISEPIQSDYGYHIIEVLDIKDSLEDSREDIENNLKTQKYLEEVEDMVDDANIKRHIDLEKEPQGVIDRLEEEKQEQENTNVENPEESNTDQSDENVEESTEDQTQDPQTQEETQEENQDTETEEGN